MRLSVVAPSFCFLVRSRIFSCERGVWRVGGGGGGGGGGGAGMSTYSEGESRPKGREKHVAAHGREG